MNPFITRLIILGMLATASLSVAMIVHPDPLGRFLELLPYVGGVLITFAPFLFSFFIASLHHPQATHGTSDFLLLMSFWSVATVLGAALIGYHRVARARELYKPFLPIALTFWFIPGPRSSDIGAMVFAVFLITQLPAALIGGALGWRIGNERRKSNAEKV